MVRAPSLGRLVYGYLITLKSEGKSCHSVAYYRRMLNNFLWWCDEQGTPQDVEVITAAHVRNFLLYIRTELVSDLPPKNGASFNVRLEIH